MVCPRCQGLMVHHWFLDLWDKTRQEHCEGWRCVNCGDLLDRVILQNEARRSVKTSTAPLRGSGQPPQERGTEWRWLQKEAREA